LRNQAISIPGRLSDQWRICAAVKLQPFDFQLLQDRFSAGLVHYTIPTVSHCNIRSILDASTDDGRPSVTTTPTPSICSGETYAIQSGDTCQSISEANRVGTAWLLSDNRLEAYCAGFPTSGNLCIRNQCNTYVVKANDTCLSIASGHGLSQVQLYTCRSLQLSCL
jgi:LysM repeat protein